MQSPSSLNLMNLSMDQITMDILKCSPKTLPSNALVSVATKISLGLNESSTFYFINTSSGQISKATAATIKAAVPVSSGGHIVYFLCREKGAEKDAKAAFDAWKVVKGLWKDMF